jgi:hypothetical protein
VGDEHATAAAPSSEQVVLVGEPVVVQAKVALVDVVLGSGPLVIATVGALPESAVTLQEYDAALLPDAFATVTLNVCDPTASPL